MINEMNIHETPKKIAFAGDWHGQAVALQFLRSFAARGVDTVIHLGDFGYWPYPSTVRSGNPTSQYLDRLSKFLVDNDMRLFFVDGNHENHPVLNDLPFKWGTQIVSRNIHRIPRGFQWEWNGVKYMGLGGAHSVDSHRRREGVDWFREELISDEELEVVLRTEGGVDVLLAHDTPDGYTIPGIAQNAQWILPYQLQAAIIERRRLSEVAETLQPKLWMHGHYHVRYNSYRPFRSNPELDPMRVIGLADEKAYPASDNYIIVDEGEVLGLVK